MIPCGQTRAQSPQRGGRHALPAALAASLVAVVRRHSGADFVEAALPQAVRVLTDAALCGPVTLALPQDVQIGFSTIVPHLPGGGVRKNAAFF